jgi:mRNA-degrading endonuclease RelE of RelBE toxin-antitoxin system
LLVTAEFYDRAIEAIEDAEDIAAARGDYRVVYSIADDVLLVLVVAGRHRREAYRR